MIGGGDGGEGVFKAHGKFIPESEFLGLELVLFDVSESGFHRAQVAIGLLGMPTLGWLVRALRMHAVRVATGREFVAGH